MESSEIVVLLRMGIYIILGVIVVLFGVYFYLMKPKAPKTAKEKEEMVDDVSGTTKTNDQNWGKFTGNLTRESIFEFMEFDEIVDSMIVRKNGTQYIMILQCNGVNYDLMSEDEKISVEEGFVQFLNTLRFPIQLYIQSRTLNLRDIIDEYKSRVDNLTIEIDKLDAKIAQAQMSGNKALKEKLEFEKRRKINILEYGIDITDYVDKLSSNRNVLQQRTYVVVSYYSAEIGGGLDKYSKEEIYNMCFAELYTRCQNIASALATSQISSTILDSEELAELLYVAYNRDEAEVLQLGKALDAQYDALYSSGKDVLQKKKEKLDQEINIAAIDMATDSILKADRLKQIEDLDMAIHKEEKIRQKANEILDTYQNQLDPRVYQLAKNEVKKNEKKEELKAEETPKLDAAKSTVVKKKVVRRRKVEEN
ncbi:MAG: hypothetical protein IJW20_01275 [Clostridia bacterium]|nr:hypothetical protein [Clostridia bacterium]